MTALRVRWPVRTKSGLICSVDNEPDLQSMTVIFGA